LPKKITPIAIVKIPANWVMRSSWTDIRAPNSPKSRPYEIKSALNPSTKRNEPMSTFPRDRENPAAYVKYPGTSGRTHGDRNEMRPARTAIGKAVSKKPSMR
jgi:hypothetical protein